MRLAMRFAHTVAAAGLVGALLAYLLIILFAPKGSAQSFADARETINVICDYLLLPSLAVALVTGLLSMVVHRPFQEFRWVWLKALLGLSMFEATLGIVGSKANAAAELSAKIAAGAGEQAALDAAIASEWTALLAILALSLANYVLGVWRPRLWKQPGM